MMCVTYVNILDVFISKSSGNSVKDFKMKKDERFFIFSELLGFKIENGFER